MKLTRRNLAVALLTTVGVAMSASGVTHAIPRSAGDDDGGRGFVAVQAGTIHLVEGDRVLDGGATILIKDGRIQAIGKNVDVPADAQIVDYGPDAVVIPGLVAADSTVTNVRPTGRTAQPGLRAIDGFDFYAEYAYLLTGGVTTAYVPAARSRLLGGQGAMVKLFGDDFARRTLATAAVLQGAIDVSARNAPGYWDPPIPATVDNDMGFRAAELPRTTMGAVVALNELLELAHTGDTGSVYGPHAGKELAALLEAHLPWRIVANTAPEIRALLDFAAGKDIKLVIDGGAEAGDVANELSAAGVAVVFELPFSPSNSGQDYGKSEDDRWPDFTVPATLVAAGAKVAISARSARDLLFAAGAASKGGLSPAAALRAITLTPAELLGVADRVGSLQVGKDADFVVLNGPPLSGQAGVLATWSDGRKAWQAHESNAVVLEVEELHVGDGEVLRPGQILLLDGRIAEVGERVAHPRGTTVIRGKAAMPGMIDSLGHLGLEGSRRVVGPEYALSQIVAPGDDVDRRVAAAGITTVGMSPRGTGGNGTPIMAYKPAGRDLETQVIEDPAALRLRWTDSNRQDSGKAVTALLEKAVEYRKSWIEYEAAIAAWTPPPPEPAAEEKADEKKDDKEAAKDEGDEAAKDEKKDDKKKGKKKDKELEPNPVTGVWSAEDAGLKMRIHLEAGEGSGAVTGNVRCAGASEDLVDLDGFWDREGLALNLAGLGSRGWISMVLTLKDEKLTGTLSVEGGEIAVTAERTSKEFVVVERPERRAGAPEPGEPKGKPKEPRRDARLEPLRRALEGKTAVLVEVEREDEILDCVAAFAAVEIRPVLLGAEDAHLVADEIAGRVAGVLLSQAMLRGEPKKGTNYRAPWSDIQNAGIPVAFHSDAEEGAVDLPLMAAYAVANGMSPVGALRALTSDAAKMLSIDSRVGRLARGLDADVLLLDGTPLAPGTSVLRAWVNGVEVR